MDTYGATRQSLLPVTNGRVVVAEETTALSLGNEKYVGDPVDAQEEDMPLTVRIRRKVKDSCQDCCTVKTLKRKLPIIQWLPRYRCREFQCDLIAGLTVGLTVIPQGLAYAIVAGLPPQYGLYSAFMGCFVYMFMGTSKDITLGPTAIMSLMVGTFAAGTGDDVHLAIMLTLIGGVVQLVMGLLNLGFLVNYISHPVINSFTSAAAVTIAFGQIKNVLGLSKVSQEFLHMVYDTCRKIPETNPWDLLMGVISMIFLYIFKTVRQIKWKDDPDTPVPLYKKVLRKILWLSGTGANAIVVIVAAGITAGMMEHGINVISITGNITKGLPDVEIPRFSSANMTVSESFTKIGAGFIIVPLLGLVESIAIGKAFARVNNYKIDATQELLAIGAANIISAFFNSYPITGSFSRTAVNSQSGVRTPASGLFTGLLILLTLEFLVQYCYYIPKSALAGVIIMAVIQMFDYEILPILWRTNKWDLFIHIVTFICSLCVGIEYGILIGIGVSLLGLLYPTARPKLKLSHQGNVVIIQPNHGLYFPAVDYLESNVLEIALSDEKPKSVILDMSHISGMDYSSLHGLKALIAEGRHLGINIVLCGVSPPVLKEIEHEKIPNLKVCSTVEESLEELHGQGKDEEEPFIAHL